MNSSIRVVSHVVATLHWVYRISCDIRHDDARGHYGQQPTVPEVRRLSAPAPQKTVSAPHRASSQAATDVPLVTCYVCLSPTAGVHGRPARSSPVPRCCRTPQHDREAWSFRAGGHSVYDCIGVNCVGRALWIGSLVAGLSPTPARSPPPPPTDIDTGAPMMKALPVVRPYRVLLRGNFN